MTVANTHELTQLPQLVGVIPPNGGKPGAHCYRQQRILGGRAYDSQPRPRPLAEQGLKSGLA